MLELAKFLPQPALHKSYLMVIREGKGSFEDLLEISMQGCYMIKFFSGGGEDLANEGHDPKLMK